MSGRNIRIEGSQGIIVGDHNTQQLWTDAESGLRRRGLDEVAERLAALQAAFAAEQHVLDNAEEADQSLDDVARQLGSGERPNKLTVTSILNGIAAAAGAATGIATAARQLAEVVYRVF
jgi:hypothetical protein